MIESQSKEYRAWVSMRQRCYYAGNPETYARYGGRGITVCVQWRDSYQQFLADVGRAPSKDHQLDRKDNNKGYGPDNCEWTTRKRQANNRRSNNLIEMDGVTKTLAEWAEEYGIDRAALSMRIYKYGWDPKTAITTPVRAKKKNSTNTTSKRRQRDGETEGFGGEGGG